PLSHQDQLGFCLADPDGLEGKQGRHPGLGLLPLKTLITTGKVARQRMVTSNYPQVGLPITGYEIHQGRSRLLEAEMGDNKSAYRALFDDHGLGIVDVNQSIWGSYLHGMFDNSPWRRAWLNQLRSRRGLPSLPTGVVNYREQREALLNSLADTIESHLDLTPILRS
ncbi:MAG: cobyric acid synthase CobQ, partial [Moorea sp. SIO3C2]|nr:cobyric acid synthase CobQ [Moorena sp. SIO3C2]